MRITTMATITFLGTGLLGSAFAEAASRRGDAVTAWNRSPDKLLALAPFGVKAAATPADAVRGAERVHLILKDDAVVAEVIAAARPGLAADAVVIDHSTTQPQLTAERAARLGAEGIRYLHCPVFMGPSAARNAQGSMLVSGPEAIFNGVKAELARMTGRLDYLGERPDLAALHKLFGNAMFIGLWAVMADILTLAKAGGVAPEDAIKLLGTLDLNAVVAARGTTMASCNFKPTFELAMARKDVQLMLDTAGELPLAALRSVAARMDQLIASGYGAEDAGVLAIDAVRQS
ncbi:NAD(P)-dependent oxidoreductase [Propionivibrio sp.]|uniref:NAD(P)-dependent oxidoreductase n=1 Tax=Propionivibrio sp. TaxID=2212460 RepID=UPI00272E158B|nr:NAD(P)-binding domain-containing protein [Propionivibrio sp.]